MRSSRVICIGDVHGCLEEAQELLVLIDYVPGQDELIFLGDIIDRGPYPVECIRWIRNDLKAKCVLGNHDQKAIEFFRREARAMAGGLKNETKIPSEQRLREWKSLSTEDLDWIRSLPAWLDIGHNWIAVHAGFEPIPLEIQDRENAIRIRWVKDGKMAKTRGDSLDQPEKSDDWFNVWPGPQNIIYGHTVQRNGRPRINMKKGYQTVGIDTGCCFGGAITAVALEKGVITDICQVSAHREYARYPADSSIPSSSL